jgi:hypothetical protein
MKIKSLASLTVISLLASGCFETKPLKVSNEEANKLPICIETDENYFTMSQGTISEVGGHYKILNAFKMTSIPEGQQLVFNFGNNELNITLDTRYQALEKGACMEVFHVKYQHINGDVLEGDSSNRNDYRTLTRVAESVFKF